MVGAAPSDGCYSRLQAALIRSSVCSSGALVETSRPNFLAMSLTRAGFKGKPPASMAAIRSSARCLSVSGSCRLTSLALSQVNRFIFRCGFTGLLWLDIAL